jgi:OOP family OmpA-OmpF porin
MTTADQIATQSGMADFVEKVFFGGAGAKAVAAGPAAAAGDSLATVLFDFDKANVKQTYKQDLEKVADLLKKNPAQKIRIEGYTDDRGSKGDNQKLSDRRADAVKAYLVETFKVDAARIETIGYGFDNPVADNKTRQGRQKNRRSVMLKLQ